MRVSRMRWVCVPFGLLLVPVEDLSVEDHPEEASVEPKETARKKGGFASEVGNPLPQGVVCAFDFAVSRSPPVPAHS